MALEEDWFVGTSLSSSASAILGDRRMLSHWIVRSGVCVSLAAIVLFSLHADDSRQAKDKATQPDRGLLDGAIQKAKEAYGPKYAAAATSEKKRALAEELLQKAGESRNDLPTHFTLLRLARDIAAGAGDARLALRAVDELDATYNIESSAMRMDVLTRAAENARDPEDHQEIAGMAMGLMREAVCKEDFAALVRLGLIAQAEARKSGNEGLVKRAVGWMTTAKDAETLHAEFDNAQSRLTEKPTDPYASMVVGKYLCVVKGDWNGGLPKLVQGSDKALGGVASMDLQCRDDDLKSVLLVAGRWWEIGMSEKGLSGIGGERRAAILYQNILPRVSGLQKDLVLARLSQLADRSEGGSFKACKPFDFRQIDRRKSVLEQEGGTMQTERAVAAALDWLTRHQNVDGSWSLTNYASRCRRGNVCSGEGKIEKVSIGATALALLPFLGAGHEHTSRGPYKRQVDKAIRWLMQKQLSSGAMFEGPLVMYEHGMATVALCEAYGMTGDVKVREAAQKACCIHREGSEPFRWMALPAWRGGLRHVDRRLADNGPQDRAADGPGRGCEANGGRAQVARGKGPCGRLRSGDARPVHLS